MGQTRSTLTHATDSNLASQAFDPVTKEWCGDHNKPIPVIIPGSLDLSFGESWSGSPYLGLVGALPQGHPGLNTHRGLLPHVALPQ